VDASDSAEGLLGGVGGVVAASTSGEDREWAAEKRDFVSDRRDDLAAERDGIADARDHAADERQSQMDEWERNLLTRTAELGLTGDGAVARRGRVEARSGRDRSLERREVSAGERGDAAGAREEASRRRHDVTPTTRLASAFADIAQHLFLADTLDDVLQRIAETAVFTVAGCQMASVTLREQGAYVTAATTASTASAVDQVQYDAHEGPCVDAIDAPMVYAGAFPDGRWPNLASRPVDFGAQSALSYQLGAASLAAAETGGSLNAYGGVSDAFTDEAQQIGLILAAHASMAAGAIHERGALQSQVENLNLALLSRDVIGQAKGILMERLKISPEDAFDTLRHASQMLNEKLHAVARRVAETGEL
jgi:hypothetical protein